MKKTLFAIALTAVTGLFLTSCNKTVTTGKIDGEWDVTSGTVNSSYEDDDYTSTSSSNFNGSVMTTTTTTKYNGGTDTDTESSDVTMSYTFDKKTGEYTMTRVANETYVDNYSSYYEYDSNLDEYVYKGYFERTVDRTSTTTETGLFTISGDAGDDIEKNSQVVFHVMSTSVTYSDAYTYNDSSTDDVLDRDETYIQGTYNPNTGEYSYDKVDKSAAGTETYSGSSTESPVWNVTELKGGEMTVEGSDKTVYTDSEDDDAAYTSETTVTWTLTKK
jgi:hypothetical protein